jgi:hypothetical protein
VGSGLIGYICNNLCHSPYYICTCTIKTQKVESCKTVARKMMSSKLRWWSHVMSSKVWHQHLKIWGWRPHAQNCALVGFKPMMLCCYRFLVCGYGLIGIDVIICVTLLTTYVHLPLRLRRSSHARLLWGRWYHEVMTPCDVIKVMTSAPENMTETLRWIPHAQNCALVGFEPTTFCYQFSHLDIFELWKFLSHGCVPTSFFK